MFKLIIASLKLLDIAGNAKRRKYICFNIKVPREDAVVVVQENLSH